MSDPAAFLAVQLDKLEATAKDGGFDSWHTKYCAEQPGSAMFGDCECDVPATVLRNIDAHRKIAELHSGSHECSCYDKVDGVMTDDIDNCTWIAEHNEPCSTLELLAQGYGWTP